MTVHLQNPRYTEAEWLSLGEYFNDLRQELGLRDWDIWLSRESCHEDASADVYVTYGKKEAVIRVAGDWTEWPDWKLRYVLVHECLHCHLNHLLNLADTLRTNVGDHAYGAFKDVFTFELERGLDGIAREIARHYPTWQRPQAGESA